MPKLPRQVLQTIDVEIRDIIVDLNKLPFVQTIFSCAGYGKAGEGERHPNEWRDDPKEHLPTKDGRYQGYVMLALNLDAKAVAKIFDEQLTQIFDKRTVSAHWTRHLKKDGCNVRAITYEFWGTPQHLAAGWKKVRKEVKIWQYMDL